MQAVLLRKFVVYSGWNSTSWAVGALSLLGMTTASSIQHHSSCTMSSTWRSAVSQLKWGSFSRNQNSGMIRTIMCFQPINYGLANLQVPNEKKVLSKWHISMPSYAEYWKLDKKIVPTSVQCEHARGGFWTIVEAHGARSLLADLDHWHMDEVMAWGKRWAPLPLPGSYKTGCFFLVYYTRDICRHTFQVLKIHLQMSLP